ncbi:MAG: SDR family NAD(P)-dependent oxidoreductase, partial [Bdellovibrionales bacterium]|nr:SDR family NAD(P)-dependent oxidoreductase [Bdellovibrionales bacterium]
MEGLVGKRIIITGGTLGIGYRTAATLIEAGAHVAITGRDSARVQQAANELGAHGISADVSQIEDIDRSFAEALDHLGGLDCLINNAGIGCHKPLIEIAPEDLESVFRVNVFGALYMAQRAAKIFIDQNFGDIVNIASTAGLRGYAGGSIYSASKFAL